MSLRSGVIGVTVRCAVCGDVKKPVGRAEPPGVHYCTHECDGYYGAPHPGSLWPGESEADFGYTVSLDGTNQAERAQETQG